jgi:predicted dehydrogenase
MTRVAIVGLGAVTRNIHLPAYAQLRPRVEVVGGCDPDPAARALAQSRWQVPRVFPDMGQLLTETTPDVVAICTPPALHRVQAEQALAAGCHVFCEKPLAETREDAAAMAAAASAAGRRIVVNNQFPYMQIHLAAKAQIGTAEFGALRYLHVWHTMAPTAHSESGWRGALERRLGFEFGVHVLDLARWLFGADPVRLFAHMPRPDPRVTWDAINVITLDFADGRAASIVLDRLSAGRDRYLDMRLDGEHAIVHTAIGGQLRLALGLHTRERRPFLEARVAGGGQAVLERGTRSRLLATDGRDPFASATALHFRNFLDALERGTVPNADISDNRRTLDLVLASYESAESGRPVDLVPGA